MMKRILLLVSLLLPLLVTAAEYDEDHDQARVLRESGEIVSLEQILENIHDQYPGRLLEVKLVKEAKGLIYEIELLDTEGKVWELELDAVTGTLLEREQDD